MTPDVESVRWRHRIVERLQNHDAPKVFRLCLFDGKSILYSAAPLDLPDGTSGNVCSLLWSSILSLIPVTVHACRSRQRSSYSKGSSCRGRYCNIWVCISSSTSSISHDMYAAAIFKNFSPAKSAIRRRRSPLHSISCNSLFARPRICKPTLPNQ
jgi:hypothetical protein